LSATAERRFASVSLARYGLAGPLWLLGLTTVLVFAVDWLWAMVFDTAARLGWRGAVLAALAVTVVVLAAREVFDRLTLPRALDTRALRAALQAEMDVAGEGPTETERLEVTAARAWGRIGTSGELDLLVLDGGADGVLCLRGPAVCSVATNGTDPVTVPGRFTVETLRFTQAIMSLAARGERIALSRLTPAQHEAVAPAQECAVFPLHALPPALLELVRPKAIDYRA
jgi:hypothetical protein